MEAIAMAQQSWTDDRLEERFDHLDAEIKTLRAETKAGHAELRSEIKASSAELRKEIKASSAELRREIKESSAELRREIKASSAELRKEIKEGNSELRAEIGGLHAEFGALNRTLIQTGFGLAAAIVAAVLVHLL